MACKFFISLETGAPSSLMDLTELDVGLKENGDYGNINFNIPLNDWSKFDINRRTKHDASISSGLAIMANNRHLYTPHAPVVKPKLNISIARYSNEGNTSKLIKE